MTLETPLEFGTSDEITFPFRYCTTCKRLLECVRFNFTRKTCDKCLSKSRDRANLRRCKLQFGNTTLLCQRVSETLAKLKASGKRICSSCKVAKTLSSFATKRKTCKTCLLEKKQRRNCQHAGRCRHLKNTASWCWNCFTSHHGEHVAAVKIISMSKYQPRGGARRSQRVPNVPCAQI
jgi:hypothetical protein